MKTASTDDHEWLGYDEDNPECELYVIEAELEMLYDLEHALIPFVDDGVRGEIYVLQDERDRLKRQIEAQT